MLNSSFKYHLQNETEANPKGHKITLKVIFSLLQMNLIIYLNSLTMIILRTNKQEWLMQTIWLTWDLLVFIARKKMYQSPSILCLDVRGINTNHSLSPVWVQNLLIEIHTHTQTHTHSEVRQLECKISTLLPRLGGPHAICEWNRLVNTSESLAALAKCRPSLMGAGQVTQHKQGRLWRESMLSFFSKTHQTNTSSSSQSRRLNRARTRVKQVRQSCAYAGSDAIFM